MTTADVDQIFSTIVEKLKYRLNEVHRSNAEEHFVMNMLQKNESSMTPERYKDRHDTLQTLKNTYSNIYNVCNELDVLIKKLYTLQDDIGDTRDLFEDDDDY